jgi:hypothetical protein
LHSRLLHCEYVRALAELGTLLNEIDVRKALDLVVKAMKTNELAQHDSRIVETERLIEIAASRKFLGISIPLSVPLLLGGTHQANRCGAISFLQ